MLARRDIDLRLEEFREICKRRGLRITPQRSEVFREVAASEEHPHAEEILKRVRRRMPNISLDTVYRILYWLENEGFIRRVQVSGDRLRFDGISDSHHHFVCSKCGMIRDFSSKEIDNIAVPAEALSLGRVNNLHMQALGVCSKCLEKRKSGKSGRS